MPAFVLCLAGVNAVLENKSRKRGAIVFVDSSRIEIIFTLLAEPIAVQMRFSKIQVGKTSLEELLFWLHWERRNLDWGHRGLG